ncbi:hypothetical protein, conserved [Leishmania tarentolae]|uniref:Defective in cullin neddylation protein n=1 Tax=Leishmania tarentolae TaxID=5689 RepID=A0A640KSZ0_LEITA|nr:hypothetical protein, conserved [Leishmania tarentolae]
MIVKASKHQGRTGIPFRAFFPAGRRREGIRHHLNRHFSFHWPFSLLSPCAIAADVHFELLHKVLYRHTRNMKNANRRRTGEGFTRERTLSTNAASAAARSSASPASVAKGPVMQFVSKGARSDMELLFDRLHALDKSAQSDAISGKGLVQFLSDVGVTEPSLECMVLLWKLGATQKGRITRSEWLIATYTHDIDSIMHMRQKLREWVKDVCQSGGSFLLMYNYLYDYIRGEEDRRMTLTTAISAWDVFFSSKDLYKKWKAWALLNLNGGVSRDLWRQLGIFLTIETTAAQHSGDQISSLPWSSAIADFMDENPVPAL